MKRGHLLITVIISLHFGLVATLSSLILPVTVRSPAELDEVYFGFPLGFVRQNLGRYEPPFPWAFHLTSPLENPTSILAGRFFINMTLLALPFFLLLLLSHWWYRKRKRGEN